MVPAASSEGSAASPGGMGRPALGTSSDEGDGKEGQPQAPAPAPPTGPHSGHAPLCPSAPPAPSCTPAPFQSLPTPSVSSRSRGGMGIWQPLESEGDFHFLLGPLGIS